MTNPMIERVAKAIYEGRNGPLCRPWPHVGNAHQAPYLTDAKNAVRAMRRPTKEMVLAALETGHFDRESDGGYSEGQPEPVVHIWLVMNEAALKEE